MASMLDLKRRIKSVNSTRQITKAMNLVASSKLTRSRNTFDSTKPFFDGTVNVISEIIKRTGRVNNPFLNKREVKNTAIIVITGDRGLCGGYNINACKQALSVAEGKQAGFIVIGSKGREYFKARKLEIKASYKDISEKPSYDNAKEVVRKAVDMYIGGEADEVYLVYTEFISTISNRATSLKLLPLDAEDFKQPAGNEQSSISTLTIYEPDEETVLEYIIPRYLNTVVFGAMAESAVCELSSRMMAMDAATDNADDMLERLSLNYNRARQGAITQEITEIVSGSNALE